MTDKYIIVEGSINPDEAFQEFKEDVNEKIEEGYVPFGAPQCSGGWIIQAMLKKKGSFGYPHQPNPLGGF